MSTPKPNKGRVADQAQVFTAFVKAFGRTLMAGRGHHQAVTAQLHETPEGTSRLWAKNAQLIMEDGITLLLDELQAEIIVHDAMSPLIPEKRESYSFHIQVGVMAMDPLSLSTLMNRYAFPPGVRAPLYDLKVTLPGNQLVLEGTLRLNRFMAVNITIRSRLAVTPDGQLELTPVEIKSGALPVNKLMSALGVDLGKLMPPGSQERGAIGVEGDRFLIDPTAMFPAPKASGRLVHAEVTGEHLVMTYDNGARPSAPPLLEAEAPAYIAMLGHDLLVGKITMTDLCLQMVPLDADADWLEFSLPQYRLQLAQGESSLQFADELLYRLPAVAALKTDRLPRAENNRPSQKPQA